MQSDQVPETPWQFNEGSDEEEVINSAPAKAATPVPQTVQWTASEFVAHQKGTGWYVLLGIGAIVIGGGIYLLTHDSITMIVILFAALVFGIFAAHQPRVLQYIIDGAGLHVEDKIYLYESFKSFAVVEEDAIHSVLLMPMKRFMPALNIYYAPEDEPKIVDALSAYLPFQPAENDLIDRLMRKIRF